MYTVGNKLRISLFGRSHADCIGCVIEGLPLGMEIDEDFIAKRMELRKPSDGIGTPRKEKDEVVFESGVSDGKVIGRYVVDVGDSQVKTGFRKIRSIHDFKRTPGAGEIVKMLSEGDQEISKGAFLASSFSDLHSIFTASKELGRKHVLLGMGEMGEITRIRQRILGNEFTFGYHGESTAPGQFSADEMESFGDDCQIAGVTGHPLQHSKSPVMQNAAIKKAGINAVYLRFDSPTLENVCDVIREYEIRGMNVTIPYKQDIFRLLDKAFRYGHPKHGTRLP